ncbi:hypothetical protein BDN72DRAFT_82762 [Pluteus cervinus]|uniref:Uncharacterized protein n=1 Tax=Pluteus cervinus TaxID=181527 RepID=A0ACD3AQB5_9AGAR|nr:hypothetical protein BDN72DRAFT_82762 [Pluteus cervinus]
MLATHWSNVLKWINTFLLRILTLTRLTLETFTSGARSQPPRSRARIAVGRCQLFLHSVIYLQSTPLLYPQLSNLDNLPLNSAAVNILIIGASPGSYDTNHRPATLFL